MTMERPVTPFAKNRPPQPAQVRMQPPAAQPAPTPVPAAFMSEEAEAEIRRNVTRHYQQVSEIASLKNDVDHWKHRAELAEDEVQNLQTKIVQLETRHEAERHTRDHEVDDLKEVINTLQAQFEAGARIWLGSYDVLKRLNPRVVTPQQLADHREDDTDAA
jgi:hypothetical protein